LLQGQSSLSFCTRGCWKHPSHNEAHDLRPRKQEDIVVQPKADADREAHDLGPSRGDDETYVDLTDRSKPKHRRDIAQGRKYRLRADGKAAPVQRASQGAQTAMACDAS